MLLPAAGGGMREGLAGSAGSVGALWPAWHRAASPDFQLVPEDGDLGLPRGLA